MTIREALRGGVQSLNRRKQMAFLFYAVTTIWALAIVAPVMGLLFASLGNSAWAEQMAPNFDLQWGAELIAGSGWLPFPPALAAALVVFAAAWIAHLFLVGGALELFCARQDFSLGTFFQGCGRHFWRLVRLALVSALFYVVASAVNAGLAGIGKKVWGEGSVQTPLVYWGWLRIAVLVLLFGLVNLIFDYARIRLVATDSRKAFRTAVAATRFVFTNFGRAAGLYVGLWVILLVVLAAYRGLAGLVVQRSLALVIVLLVIRQITVLAKIWAQLLFYSSEAEMYLALAPVPAREVAPVEPVHPEPEPSPSEAATPASEA